MNYFVPLHRFYKSARKMKPIIKWAFSALMFLLAPSFAVAQDKPEAYVDADVVTSYMWRGQKLGNVSLQPEMGVNWKGLNLEVWGSVGLEHTDTREIDVTLGYSNFGFNVGVTDYWSSGVDENDLYFNFNKKGAHQLEANLGYTCKWFSLQAYTMVWGNDFKVNGQQAYSTYIELGVPFTFGDVDWELKAGVTPFESAGVAHVEDEQTDLGIIRHTKYDFFYAEGFACVQASLRATKTLDLGFAKLPLFAEFHANPYMQTLHVIGGLTITPFKK